MSKVIWPRDATPQQIEDDLKWRAANERRIEACIEAGMPIPPHYWDAEGERLRHKLMLMEQMTPHAVAQDVTLRPEYKAQVVRAFEEQERAEQVSFRERKAAVEYAGRKRL